MHRQRIIYSLTQEQIISSIFFRITDSLANNLDSILGQLCQFFTARKTKFLGKVILSQVLVCPQGLPVCLPGLVFLLGDLPTVGMHPAGFVYRGVCIQGVRLQESLHPGGSTSGDLPTGGWADPSCPIRKASGTHPTGMHFCLQILFCGNSSN